MNPSRYPPYTVNNDGTGPYALFQCEHCGREYRTQAVFVQEVKQQVTKSALSGFLRNIPIVGDAAANQVEGDQYRTTLTKDELAKAWADVGQNFQECQACRQVVCIPDFDVQTGFCKDDSPRSTELQAREAEQAGAQAAAFLGGLANMFGAGDAIKAGAAQAAANQAPAAATQAAAAANQAPAAQAAAAAPCANCGAALAAGARFCANCGTPTAVSCASCGTALAAGARFCANCGTPVA